jgi:hypothetical protein
MGRLVLLPLVLILFVGAALAQLTSGSISGEVKDPSGAYVPKASVTVTAPEIGVAREVKTNNDGTFNVPNLPRGTYIVTVKAAGFKELEKKNLVLSVGDRLNAGDFVLQVGGGEQTVTVEADAGQVQIQSDSGERSGLVTGAQLNNLAMNGRMLLDYVKVLPGVISTFNGAASDKGGMNNIKINGTRPGAMQYTLDGVTNVDNGCNCASQVTINPDAVAEMKVLTSNFQAEYGKASGATVAVVTKNGTNQFHGGARWFHRHEQFNAQQWFDEQANHIAEAQGKPDPNPKQKYRYNYFGFQIGGPVLVPKTGINKNKDKLFFFFNQEYYRQLLPGGFDKIYVPTLDEINGDFTNSYDGYGKKIALKNLNAANGTPIVLNNRIVSGINPAVQQYLLKVLPRPNSTDTTDCTANGSVLPGGLCNKYNFITGKTTDHPRREDIGRVDYQINQNNRLYFTYVNNQDTEYLPEGMSPQGTSNFTVGSGMHLDAPGYNASIHLTSNLSDKLINELTFGTTINQQRIYSNGGFTDASKWDFNIPLLYSVAANSPVPDLTFSGRNQQTTPTTYLGSLPWSNADTVINFTDNVTKLVNKHTLKAGIFIERNRKDQSSWGNANGNIKFSGNDSNQPASMQAGDPFANALLGFYTSYQQQNGRIRGLYRYTNIEFFAQDNYKLTHRLTLDYGMRFAWVQPQYDASSNVAYFDKDAWDPAKAVRLYKTQPGTGVGYDSATGATVSKALIGTIVPGSGDLLNGITTAKSGGYAGGFQDRGIMIEPRFGFALDVFGTGKSVLRGGVGMSHNRFQGNPIYNLVVGNPPNSYDPTFNYGTLTDIASLKSNNSMSQVGVYGFDKHGKVPTTYSYSLGVQHNLGWNTTLDIAYVGSQSRHLSQKHNLNAIPYGYLFTQAAQDPSKYTGGVVPTVEAGITSVYTNAGLNYMGDKAYDQKFLEPYPNFANVEYWTWDGNSNYNSLQIGANKRMGHGVTLGVAYTWSKTMDTSNADGDWTNIVDVKKYNYTLANWDRPHVLAINWTYDLPKVSKHLGGSKLLSYLFDGYQWEGIGQFLQGGPGTINGNWTNGNGGTSYTKQISGSYTEGPRTYMSGNPTGRSSDPYAILNPNAFVTPSVLGIPGTAWQQNYYRSGGTNNWDMSIFKNIPLGSNEARYIQMRVEAFNVFNHPQFWGINTDAGAIYYTDPATGAAKMDPTSVTNNWTQLQVVNPAKIRPAGKTGNIGQYFGEYNSGGNARIIQLGLKLYF